MLLLLVLILICRCCRRFYSSYLSRKENEKDTDIASSLMTIVMMKLLGKDLSLEDPTPATLDASSIAVLSARLLLDLSPSSSKSRKYEEEQVRAHMRMVYSVHQDRVVLVTGSSPEPLIAEASARIMNYVFQDQKQTRYMDLWGLLAQFIDEGLLAQGTIGELIGRVLSIFAMDRAINDLPPNEQCQLIYQTPVRVTAYYKALLTDDAWERLRESTPANRSKLTAAEAKVTFEDAFDDAYVHFSHWAKANDATPLCDRYAWALWLRGTAVLCQLNQELTDRAIPIFFSHDKPSASKNTLSSETVSMIFDQDKTSLTADPQTVAIQSAEDLNFFSSGNKRPYIAAVHCYARSDGEDITVSTPSGHTLRGSGRTSETAPRYQIDFRGLTAYRDTSSHARNHILAMIDNSKEALFKKHPRKYAVPQLRKMQPVLAGDVNTTAWFGKPDLSL